MDALLPQNRPKAAFRFFRIISTLLLGLVGSVFAAAPETAPVTFSPTQLREDYAVLRLALERAHPGLHRYTTVAEMAQEFARAESALNAPMTEPEFLREIMTTLALVRDDHTYASPSADFWRNRIGPARYTQGSKGGDLRLFPFFITVQSGQVFITHNNSADPAIQRGTEILKINSRPIREAISIIESLMPVSGYSSTYRVRRLEQFSPQQEYNYFCVYYALFVEAPDEFTLEIRTPGTTTPTTVVVPSVRSVDLWANFRARYVATEDPLIARERPMRLEFPQPDAAVLTLSSFHDWRWRQAGFDYQKDIAAIFSIIAAHKPARLIVDLRGNEGGNPGIGVEVLGHLVSAPYQIYAYKELRDYRFPTLLPYVNNPKVLDIFTADSVESAPGGVLRVKTSLPNETWSRPLSPSPSGFHGNLYVLIDGATGSAAGQLATMLRVNRPDAIFVGEETGCDMEGPVSSPYLELKLPHTKIRVDVPVLKKVFALKNYPHERGRGVPPNHAVSRTQDDIANGRDPALQYALGDLASPNGASR